jgi:hypothetical protein
MMMMMVVVVVMMVMMVIGVRVHDPDSGVSDRTRCYRHRDRQRGRTDHLG